ncbi:MAG: hypothetical protein GF393_10795, partial [Armatimonadia bacterium]|nr:hypothetical protein [Armatimonadia bacterium]
MRSRIALMVVLITLASAALAQDAQWMMRYDEKSSGVSEASIELPASLAWK